MRFPLGCPLTGFFPKCLHTAISGLVLSRLQYFYAMSDEVNKEVNKEAINSLYWSSGGVMWRGTKAAVSTVLEFPSLSELSK